MSFQHHSDPLTGVYGEHLASDVLGTRPVTSTTMGLDDKTVQFVGALEEGRHVSLPRRTVSRSVSTGGCGCRFSTPHEIRTRVPSLKSTGQVKKPL